MNFKNIFTPAMAAAVLLTALTAGAAAREEALPAHRPGIVVTGPLSHTLPSAGASSMTIPAMSIGQSVRVSSDQTWLEAMWTPDGIDINATGNPAMATRTATVTAVNGSGQALRFTVTQPGSDLTSGATDGILYVTPSSATGGDEQPGEGIGKTIDGDLSTIYHSNWAGFTAGNEPVLTYLFDQGTRLEEIHYIPRQSGTNGNWGKVEVEVRYQKGRRWHRVEAMDADFGMSSSTGVFKVPAEIADTTFYGIRFKVMTGASDKGNGLMFASCAEIKFISSTHSPALDSSLKIFGDALCTTLKPGTTQADVDKMEDPFLKNLAHGILNGSYSSEGRVAESETLRSVQSVSDEFNAPGKLYDQVQGATGITMTRGRYVILVEGIPEHMGTTELRVIGWTVPEGHTYYSESYRLRNGINVIDRTTDWDGLAYISNYDDQGYDSGSGSTIRAHFVGAPVNGILRPTMTNDEIRRVLDNATYTTIDLMGQRVHSIWEVSALKSHTDGQWVRYINTLDILIMWEHRLLGLEKYDRIPRNKTLAYVNYNYYMYQGGFGVTFKYDTQYRVCSPEVLMKHDDDAIWGLSHEWGHQHQMRPYFCWTGMAEVSNNIFSAYNVQHMGYPVSNPSWGGRFPSRNWLTKAPRIFLRDEYDRSVAPPKDGENKTANSDGMVLSLRDVSTWTVSPEDKWGFSPELVEFARTQPKLPTLRSENPDCAVNAIEGYSGSNGELILAPWVQLMTYFMSADTEGRKAEDYRPDLYPDFFEAQRQCDDPEGSTVEKTDGVDKYELLISAFNGNKNGKREVFRSTYPTSVWTAKNYLPADRVLYWQDNSAPAILNAIRKMSRLTGYNLFDYFQRWGVITVCALEQGDYGIQHYALTQDMFDEFRADMKALEDSGAVRPLPASMIEAISFSKYPEYPTPAIPNDRPINSNDI